MSRARRVLAPLMLLCVAASAGPAAETRRVLALHSFGPRFAPFNAVANPFRQQLIQRAPAPLAISEVSLEASRALSPSDDQALIAYVHALLNDGAPDLMVAIGGPAALFFQKHRDALFPEAPLLIIATEARRVGPGALGPRDAAVLHRIDLPATIDTILATRPETREIFIVLGATPLERLWRDYAEKDLARYAGRLRFDWANDLDFDAIRARVAALPPEAAVIYGLLIKDAAGVPFEEDKALAAVSAASRAPVYGIYDSQLGQGVVGGRMVPVAALVEESVAAAERLLAGEAPDRIRLPLIEAGAPAFDSRQLARFGMDESLLPPGSRVLFREPGLWERYRWPILGVAALCLLQSAFIAGLLLNRRRLGQSRAALMTSETRLREAAEAARDFAGRLIHAQENERSRLGRELHDDITQRLAVLAIAAGQAERKAGAPEEAERLGAMREGLVRLSEDVHRLSYQLHPSILADLGLDAALESEAEQVERLSGLAVEVRTGPLPAPLPPALALCLFRVAQEALRNTARHARATRARLSLRAEAGALRLRIEDDGAGFAPEAPRARPSLGLASMRQRVAAIGGRLRVESAPGKGTRIEVEVPLEGAPGAMPGAMMGALLEGGSA